MKVKQCVGNKIAEKLPFDAWHSYRNTWLEEDGKNYLNSEHIDELKENSEITHWEELGEDEYIKGIGWLRRIGFVTKKGYAYSGLIGIPEYPESRVPVIGTSAWLTSTEGHNEHTVRNLVRAGNYVIFTGAEGSYEPEEIPSPNGYITLADSAAATLNFSYHAGIELAKQGHKINRNKRIAVGESRGGMVGMGLLALDNEFGQEVIMADFAAPCFPEKISPVDIAKLNWQMLKEPSEMVKLFGSLTLARLIHYPGTVDLSPYSLRHQMAIGFALFSGEAGLLGKHVRQDMLMHISVFKNDFASMRAVWEEIFKNSPNVRITPLPGSHMTIVDLETLQFMLGRNKAAQICLTEKEELNQATVFEAAHLFAPQQKPLPIPIAA